MLPPLASLSPWRSQSSSSLPFGEQRLACDRSGSVSQRAEARLHCLAACPCPASCAVLSTLRQLSDMYEELIANDERCRMEAPCGDKCIKLPLADKDTQCPPLKDNGGLACPFRLSLCPRVVSPLLRNIFARARHQTCAVCCRPVGSCADAVNLLRQGAIFFVELVLFSIIMSKAPVLKAPYKKMMQVCQYVCLGASGPCARRPRCDRRALLVRSA
eukprot:SAG11_NODE_1715_length_4396_cov_3.282290_3_plen_216_part_00